MKTRLLILLACALVGQVAALPVSAAGSDTLASNISFHDVRHLAHPNTVQDAASPVLDVEEFVSVDGGATWLDADTPTGPECPAGSVPLFRFVVANTGAVDIPEITLTDTAFGNLDMSGLRGGWSVEWDEIGEWRAGQQTSVATVTGRYTDDLGTPVAVSDSDAANYFGGTIHAAIEIEALTNGDEADTPPGPHLPIGSTVTWTYVVTNTGNIALSGITVTDDRGVTVNAPRTALAPGESMTATASGTATAGQYANAGRASGYPPSGPAVTASDPSHYYGVVPVNADFGANVTHGMAPLAVLFADDSTGDGITSWSWAFGDGATSTEQNPVHTYADPGTYPVNLTVTGASGADSETKAGYITVTVRVLAVPPATEVPTDTDGDDLYEDINGNGRDDFADVVLFFNQMAWISANEPVPSFDFTNNDRIDFVDVVWLFYNL